MSQLSHLISEARTMFMEAPMPAPVAKLAKALGFPGNAEYHNGNLVWRDRGGYRGDKVLKNMQQKAVAAGFHPGHSSSGASPGTGSTVSRGTVYVDHMGNTLQMSSDYGQTKADNRFTATLITVRALHDE